MGGAVVVLKRNAKFETKYKLINNVAKMRPQAIAQTLTPNNIIFQL